MADNKPSNRERIKEIVTGIEANIQDLFQSDKFADYLRTMSRFHSYSYNNTILIHMQMPSATHVAGFNKWKNQFGRHVKKGERGLTIIAPTPFKKHIEEMKLDPDTRTPVLDHDGNVIMEEREIEIPLFRPVKVFDVSQTEGRPLPSLVSSLTGDVQQYEAFMEALRRTSPVSIMFKPLREGLDGFLSLNDQTITIREGMSQVQTVCAAVHEITHAMLHNREREQLTAAAGITDREPPKPKDKNTKEVEAESVSYTVCQYYGIETSANSLGYIATWSKDKTLPELKASLETISKTANILITSIDRHFQEICKEQGIDLTAQQPEQDAPSAAPDTLEQFAADLYDFMDQLHQEGVLKHPFTQDPRERSIADLVIEMRKGYFEGVRGPLNYLIEHTDLIHTDLTKAKAMLARLDGLAESVPLKEYVYKMEANSQTVGAADQQFIQAYERTSKGTLKPDRVLFFGTADRCAGLLKKLQSGELKPDHFFQPGTARISHYKTKDGAELDAFVGPDDKVYMGRRDHYDNRGHYLNADKSLLYLSDNTVMFDFVSGSSYAATQAELLAQGCFTIEDYAEFDALRVGVLAQFEQVGQLLFAGEPFSFTQPDAAEQAVVVEAQDKQESRLDEYPLPDPAFPADELEQNYGYAGGDLLPLSRERAAELLEQDLTVYMVEAGENPAMVFDRDDLMEQPEGMMFAVPRKEWEDSPEFHQCIVDRLNHQEERERAFLDYGGDCFAIYQIKDGAEQRDLHFMNMDWLMSKGLTADRDNYDLVYTGELAAGQGSSALERLWEKFNINHPADYHRPSMSVSDIVAVKQDGVVSFHYCDSFGFAKVPDFISQKPTVAELEAQVKAGQTISLTDLADAVHREKKKSVVAQLKNQPAQERKKTAPKKSAEKER